MIKYDCRAKMIVKGGLISEIFSIWLKSSKKSAKSLPENLLLSSKVFRGVFLGDLIKVIFFQNTKE